MKVAIKCANLWGESIAGDVEVTLIKPIVQCVVPDIGRNTWWIE